MNSREIILDTLLEIEEQDVYTNVILSQVLQKYDYLEGHDKAFIKRVIQGTIERKIQIDYVLNLFSSVPVHKQKKVVRAILRSSVYQILFMDSIPDSAACNEAVKLAAKRKFGSLKGFINGVLRNISRQKNAIEYPSKEKDPLRYASVVYSMPEPLVQLFVEQYGFENTCTMLNRFLEAQAVTVRLKENLSAKEQEALLMDWKKQGVIVEDHPYFAYAKCLKKVEGIASLAGYEKGLFTVQDVSSMLVCEATGIQENDFVIDVCAAPGGKSLHALEKLNGTGQLRAFDVSEAKINRIKENFERMGYRNGTCEVADARIYKEALCEKGDVVLADVPCSGLGVMGKKQDIKYHYSEEGMCSLLDLQKEIIDNVWKYVKKGGVLLYSTCTINEKENVEQVRYILEHYPFELEAFDMEMPAELKEQANKGMVQLLPGIHPTDGFFLAKLRRKDC